MPLLIASAVTAALLGTGALLGLVAGCSVAACACLKSGSASGMFA